VRGRGRQKSTDLTLVKEVLDKSILLAKAMNNKENKNASETV